MKVKIFGLVFLMSYVYADTSLNLNSYVNDYNDVVNAANYSTVDYASARRELQIQLSMENDGSAVGYVDKVVLCDVLHCNIYSYKKNEVQLKNVPNSMYSEFKAHLKSGYLTGHICNKSYNICSDHVTLDIEYNSKHNFEKDFVLHNESAILIQKLTKSYI